MTILDGPGFDASRLDPRIRDFYEHTAAWHMEVWTRMVTAVLAGR